MIVILEKDESIDLERMFRSDFVVAKTDDKYKFDVLKNRWDGMTGIIDIFELNELLSRGLI